MSLGQQLGEQGSSAKLYCGMWHAAPVTVKVSAQHPAQHALHVGMSSWLRAMRRALCVGAAWGLHHCWLKPCACQHPCNFQPLLILISFQT